MLPTCFFVIVAALFQALFSETEVSFRLLRLDYLEFLEPFFSTLPPGPGLVQPSSTGGQFSDGRIR